MNVARREYEYKKNNSKIVLLNLQKLLVAQELDEALSCIQMLNIDVNANNQHVAKLMSTHLNDNLTFLYFLLYLHFLFLVAGMSG